MRKATMLDVFGTCAALAGLLAAAACSESPTESVPAGVEDVELSASSSSGATVLNTQWLDLPVNMEVSAEENACLDVSTLVSGVGRIRIQSVLGPNGKMHVNVLRDATGVGIESLEPGDDRTWVLRPDILKTTLHADPSRPGSPLCAGCQVFHLTQRALARALDEGPDYHIRNVAQLVIRPDGTIANFFQRREFLECFPSGGGLDG